MTKKSSRRLKKSVSKRTSSRRSKKSVYRRRSSFSIYDSLDDLLPFGNIPFRRQRAVTGLDFSPPSSPERSPRITRRSIGDVNYFNAPSRAPSLSSLSSLSSRSRSNSLDIPPLGSDFSLDDLPPLIPLRRQRATTGLDFSPPSSPGRRPRITRRSIGDVNYFNAPIRSRSNSPDFRRLPPITRAHLGLRHLPIVEIDYDNVTPQRRMSRCRRRSRSCRR